jgi:hypothetical protein
MLTGHNATNAMGPIITKDEAVHSTFSLASADGSAHFVYRWLPETNLKAVVQIAHGLVEHAGRYARLAKSLTRAGYAVYAGDHRGHGQTAPTPADLGFFADRDGWRKCVDDFWVLTQRGDRPSGPAHRPHRPFHGLVYGAAQGAPLSLDGLDLLQQQLESIELTADLTLEMRRQGRPSPVFSSPSRWRRLRRSGS